jgi:anti-sigma regulatory factor (Ser/Thr protein kinase)
MWLDEGMERLRDAVGGLDGAAGDLDALCDGVLRTMLRGSPATDDVAMIALGMTALAGAGLSLEIPADADELAGMRRAFRRWLHEAGAAPDESYEMLVAATEAAANAVEHAYGPVEATLRLEAELEDGEVAIRVRDTGSWRPPRGTNRGRGTLLMQELMDTFEVETGEGGTEVRMRKRLAGQGETG